MFLVFTLQMSSLHVQRVHSCAIIVCVWSTAKCVTSAMTVGIGLMRTTVVRFCNYVRNNEHFL